MMGVGCMGIQTQESARTVGSSRGTTLHARGAGMTPGENFGPWIVCPRCGDNVDERHWDDHLQIEHKAVECLNCLQGLLPGFEDFARLRPWKDAGDTDYFTCDTCEVTWLP